MKYDEWSKYYELWKEDCKQELKEKGYNPNNYEITEDGSIYSTDWMFENCKNVVTPWKDSVHYQE